MSIVVLAVGVAVSVFMLRACLNGAEGGRAEEIRWWDLVGIIMIAALAARGARWVLGQAGVADAITHAGVGFGAYLLALVLMLALWARVPPMRALLWSLAVAGVMTVFGVIAVGVMK